MATKKKTTTTKRKISTSAIARAALDRVKVHGPAAIEIGGIRGALRRVARSCAAQARAAMEKQSSFASDAKTAMGTVLREGVAPMSAEELLARVVAAGGKLEGKRMTLRETADLANAANRRILGLLHDDARRRSEATRLRELSVADHMPDRTLLAWVKALGTISALAQTVIDGQGSSVDGTKIRQEAEHLLARLFWHQKGAV